MPQGQGTDPVEMRERLDTVKGMIVKGLTQQDIVRACIEKYPSWGVEKRQLRNYVYEAQAELHQQASQIDFAAELVITKLQIDAGIALAFKLQDIKGIFQGAKERRDLLNLHRLRYEVDLNELANRLGYSNLQDLETQLFGGTKMEVVIGDDNGATADE